MTNRISDEELLEALRELAEDLGRPPTYQDMDERGRYGKSTYYHRFGRWAAACETAGVGQPEMASYTEAQLLSDLEDLAERLGRRPTSREVNELTEHSYSTYYRRFGGLEAACEEADLPDGVGKRQPTDRKALELRAAVRDSDDAEISVDDTLTAPEVGQWG